MVTNPCLLGFLDYKPPTLAANNVHFERGMVVPSLNMKTEKSCSDWMLEIGHLDGVTVFVTAQQLKIENSLVRSSGKIFWSVKII